MINVSLSKDILFLKKDIIKILEEKFKDKNIYLTIKCVSSKKIKELNNKYRNVDSETDVLSFPIFTKEELDNIVLDEIELGDIFLCMDVIYKNSIEYVTGMDRELKYMVVHGILHLLGYDHIEDDDKKIMRKKEEEIILKLGDKV
ncbi:MAG: rRNA maturation RNase YbeY [Clostridia bacterium]